MFDKCSLFWCLIIVGVMLWMPLWGQIVINEIYYDPPGSDTGCFTELKGPPGTSLSGYTLVGVNGNGGSEYATIDLSGQSIPTDGYFVVAQDNTVANYDMINEGTNWQNANYQGTGEGDNVLLRQGSTTVDAVGYGTFTPTGVFVGEGDPAPDVTSASIGRSPDGIDTNNNADDFAEFATTTPGETNGGGPGDPTVYDCGELQEDDTEGVPVHAGEYIEVTAIAIVANGVFDSSGTNCYIQDEFGGVNLHNYDVQPTIAEGDCGTVLGTVGHYNGLTQIDDPYFDITNHGAGTMPDPILLTTAYIAEYGEDQEGTLARLEGCNIVGGDPWPSSGNNANITIDDGSGECTLRIDKDTDLDEWTGPTYTFDLIGIINQYDYVSPYTEGFQILPRRVADITPSSSVPLSETGMVSDFRLMTPYPNPFNPGTNISYYLSSPVERLSLSVYDISGRLVTILRDAPAKSGSHNVVWNAASMPSGTYFIQLSANGVELVQRAVLVK